jgi:hypothetical protein
MIIKTIDLGNVTSYKAILLEDRKELVTSKEVISKDDVFKLLFIAIFAW